MSNKSGPWERFKETIFGRDKSSSEGQRRGVENGTNPIESEVDPGDTQLSELEQNLNLFRPVLDSYCNYTIQNSQFGQMVISIASFKQCESTNRKIIAMEALTQLLDSREIQFAQRGMRELIRRFHIIHQIYMEIGNNTEVPVHPSRVAATAGAVNYSFPQAQITQDRVVVTLTDIFEIKSALADKYNSFAN